MKRVFECAYGQYIREDSKVVVLATSIAEAVECFERWAAVTEPPSGDPDRRYQLQMIRELPYPVLDASSQETPNG